MERREFEIWYRNKQKWLSNKAHWYISNTRLPYSEVNELISLTMEEMLNKLEGIKDETVDGYCFFEMKKCLYNKMLYPIKKVCCEGDFTEYLVKDEEYDVELDKKCENRLKELYHRIDSSEEKLVLQVMLKGNKVTTLGINTKKVTKIVRKIKGIEPKKAKSKAKGCKLGTPIVYEGIAKLTMDGKLEKVYQDIKSTKLDDFTPELVRRCIKEELKHHKGFQWKLVKNLPKSL